MAQVPEPEAIQQIKSTLEPYIKPREQVAYIRRVLALHLQRQRQTDNLQRPLSLIHATDQIQHHRDTQGPQRDYLRAVRNNLKARHEYAQLLEKTVPERDPKGDQQSPADKIQEHLAIVRLQQKHDKLVAIQKYLDLLNQEPAASPDFLNLEELFRDSPELPTVPREVVNKFSSNTGSAKADLAGAVDKMEKVVLSTKLLLRQEEKLLDDVRARTEPLKANFSDAARLHALEVTRNELINWIETELSKASGGAEDDGDPDDPASKRYRAAAAETDISEQLANVKAKYANYVAMRKSLLTLVSQQQRPTLKPDVPSDTPNEESDESPAPTEHLILPYLEKLLDLSRQQKSMIQHKSHVNTVLAQQVKDTRQMLDHLSEESQLLPSHPVPGFKKGKSSFDEHMSATASDKPDTVSQVRPWVYAADSAKIATMEAVAEKVEEGHLALEGSRKALYDVDQLLGRRSDGNQAVTVGDTTEDDIWLAEESKPETGGGTRQVERPAGKQGDHNDPWSALDGKLGLMG